MRSLAEPFVVNDRYVLRDRYYLRLDAHFIDFSEGALLECMQMLERSFRERYDASFLIGYYDRDGHSVRKQPFADVLRKELTAINDSGTRDAGVAFQGFLKTSAMQKMGDLKKPWLLADESSWIQSCAYTLDGRAYPVPRMPYQKISEGSEEAKQAYFCELARFSQTDKQWLGAMTDWDVAGMITASFHTDDDGETHSIGGVSIAVSRYALDDAVARAYGEFREIALRMDACLPFVHAAIGFGDWDPEYSTYALISEPQEPPEGMSRFDCIRQYGDLLGRFNLIPKEWDERLSGPLPGALWKTDTVRGSKIYELAGEATPYHTREFLAVRKFLQPILVPMKKNTVYHVCQGPHIAPFTADELAIMKHEVSGELFPIYKG